jgi:hypothetical protein
MLIPLCGRSISAVLRKCLKQGQLRRSFSRDCGIRMTARRFFHTFSPPWGRGWTAPAFSPAGAGRAFARRRAMDAQGALPATARRRVRGSLASTIRSAKCRSAKLTHQEACVRLKFWSIPRSPDCTVHASAGGQGCRWELRHAGASGGATTKHGES